ncbi:MAG: acyloxyacyl hydrolase [Pseudomonadota bacterium]
MHRPIRRLTLSITSILAALMMSSGNAFAGIDEVRAGGLAQGVGGWSPDKETGVGINLEALFKSPGFLRAIGAPRPHLGVAIATDNDATSQIYAGLEWRQHLARRLFVAGAVGGAVHTGETDTFDPVADLSRLNNTQFLGCRALFRIAADLGVEVTDHLSVSIAWSHISNAGLCDDNEGLDNLGLRVGYRF